MGKKEKAVSTLTEDIQAIIALFPKLETFVKVHKEIVTGYQKYRKNGGEAIPGIEKHAGIKESKETLPVKAKKKAKGAEADVPEECTDANKAKKKEKKKK